MVNSNVKLITLTNDGYLEMTKNLMISMEKIGIEQMLHLWTFKTPTLFYVFFGLIFSCFIFYI